MSMTPAFSPGPWMTHGALVGSVRKWIFEDLYEQCSFHIAEKMPSSVNVGTRPISLTRRAYSSGLSPCSAISSGVMAGSLGIMDQRGLVTSGGNLSSRRVPAAIFISSHSTPQSEWHRNSTTAARARSRRLLEIVHQPGKQTAAVGA